MEVTTTCTATDPAGATLAHHEVVTTCLNDCKFGFVNVVDKEHMCPFVDAVYHKLEEIQVNPETGDVGMTTKSAVKPYREPTRTELVVGIIRSASWFALGAAVAKSFL